VPVTKDKWAQVSDALYTIFTVIGIIFALVISIFSFFLFTARNSNKTRHE